MKGSVTLCTRPWTLESFEETHDSIAHELCDDGFDVRIFWEYQGWRPTVSCISDGFVSRLAKAIAKLRPKSGALVPNFFCCRSLGSFLVEIAHDAVGEYPDKGLDIVFNFVHNRSRSVL